MGKGWGRFCMVRHGMVRYERGREMGWLEKRGLSRNGKGWDGKGREEFIKGSGL